MNKEDLLAFINDHADEIVYEVDRGNEAFIKCMMGGISLKIESSNTKESNLLRD